MGLFVTLNKVLNFSVVWLFYFSKGEEKHPTRPNQRGNGSLLATTTLMSGSL